MIHSFTMPCDYTLQNVAMVEQACAMRVEELNNNASRFNKESQSGGSSVRYHCDLRCEVMPGLDKIRVNLYGGTAKDAMMIGYNFCALQMTPSWIEKSAKSDQ